MIPTGKIADIVAEIARTERDEPIHVLNQEKYDIHKNPIHKANIPEIW
jgi:hypothetical protein